MMSSEHHEPSAGPAEVGSAASASPPTAIDRPRPQLVIALTGPLGSGVSTISRVLESEGFARLSLSRPIKDEYRHHQIAPADPLTEQAIPGLRKSLQVIGDEGRRNQGHDYWLRKVLPQAESERDLVIDGIRNLGELATLRRTYPNCFCLAVIAPRTTRWERLRASYGSNQGRFEADDLRDSEEDFDHGQQVEKCVQAADYVLSNELLSNLVDEGGFRRRRRGGCVRR